MQSSRKVAIDALLKVNNDLAYSNITLNNILKNSELSTADKQFTTALFYGVLDRKITLDYVLGTLIKTPLSKVDSFTKEVLRVGLYQIMFMDKVPDSAAVNEAVKIIKASKKRHNAGFVNAVLRASTRQEKLIPDGNSVKDLSVRFSVPEWIVESFINDYSLEDTVSLLSETLKPTPIYLRVNTLKIGVEEFLGELEKIGVKAEKTEQTGAVRLLDGFQIETSELYKKGLFYVQDLSSQKCAQILGAQKGERVLDICAAPGGKSFALAILMQNSGEILSCDLYEKRTNLISSGAKRLGIDIIKTKTNDATAYNSEIGLFDAVLCDVPCSGLGIIRRKPDIKYKEIASFSDLEKIQSEILENAVKYLKSGGRIVYSTCTLRQNENEKQVEAFLQKHPEFELKYMHTFMPHIDNTDGFFTALLLKR
ncbi:MAG: 16S rRNA (cytosine(967)-C(5))-methyltransferase RsmB [Ruminococcaceae bacterium]|nr:16S rRNA (cytosine(967)-C(5))-methyltransferase RsmB [Oscillospiraceae bacterium]